MTNRSTNPTTLPLRRWLVLALAIGFVVPVFTTGVVAYHVIGLNNEPESTAPDVLQENASRWGDPQWQEETRAALAAEDTDFVLMENGEEVYRSSDDPLIGPDGEPRQRVVEPLLVDGTQSGQVAYVYSDQSDWTENNARFTVPIAAVASLLVTLGGIAWFLGRMVVAPLASASLAARQVASGDLDIKLPTSRVREVAVLNEAFETMSDELRASLQERTRLEQERRLFISAVAHDLRTPLFSLRGSLQGLETGVADSPDKRARYVSIAQEKANALERLIADLFDFTRLEYLDQEPEYEEVVLDDLLRQSVDELQPRAEEASIEIDVASSSGPCVVSGDSHLLSRVIGNLLDNALGFTPEGGRVRVECHSEPGQVTFSVIDTGPGIPEEDLPHLFAPLFRGEESRSRRTGGAGLGLTIAHRIMQAHGGDLTARNADSGGAVFTGTLPSHTE